MIRKLRKNPPLTFTISSFINKQSNESASCRLFSGFEKGFGPFLFSTKDRLREILMSIGPDQNHWLSGSDEKILIVIDLLMEYYYQNNVKNLILYITIYSFVQSAQWNGDRSFGLIIIGLEEVEYCAISRGMLVLLSITYLCVISIVLVSKFNDPTIQINLKIITK